jgi:hypothetical protein
MAHYIAELIQDAEKATGEERPAKMQACSEAILSLWKHRHDLPDGKRPFRELEPILRALESLDPDDDTPRYFRTTSHAADEMDEKNEAKSWLKLIDGLDYSARMLIRYCMTQAAQTALDKSAKWVALAEAAGVDDGVEFPVIRVIVHEESMLKASDPDENARKSLEDRIERLEEFAKMAMTLASELREKVQQAQCAKEF